MVIRAQRELLGRYWDVVDSTRVMKEAKEGYLKYCLNYDETEQTRLEELSAMESSYVAGKHRVGAAMN